MYPLERQVGGIEGPLAIELHGLGVRELVGKAGATRPRRQERRGLESHHGSREEAQGARVHLEPLQNVARVEEPHHSDPAGRRGDGEWVEPSQRVSDTKAKWDAGTRLVATSTESMSLP